MIQLTACTWNIHHGAGMDGRIDLGRIAGTLHDAGATVIGLQEVEVGGLRSRLAHQPRQLAKRLGMHETWGPSFRLPVAGEFGNTVVSKFRIRHRETYPLPSGKEPRSMLEAHVETGKGIVGVFCTHWGLDDDERQSQARECLRVMEAFPGAALLLGDLNEDPDGPAVALLKRAGLALLGPAEPTYPADAPERAIDYVWGTPGWKALDAYAMPVLGSDHRPVVVEVTHP